MSLFDEHKAERRGRILAAARRLVAERGYDGLTMRDLAHAARVSVPTLYNLFGSKDAILAAELEATASRIAARVSTAESGFFARGAAMFDAGMAMIEEGPEFFRAVMRMFLTSPESAPVRRRVEDGFIALMAANLAAAKRAGELADWAEPTIVARHMFAQYMSTFLAWGIGEVDLPTFRAAAQSGICHILIGAARGAFAAEVEARLRELARDPLVKPFVEVGHVASRRD
jgi:AcrR family transcriptional regulator